MKHDSLPDFASLELIALVLRRSCFSSLDERDDEVAAAWATELERRSREVAEGRVQPASWPTAQTEILKESSSGVRLGTSS